MIEGYLRPPCLCEDLHQHVLCAYEALEVAKLLILIVVAASRHFVNIVKDFDADNGIDVEEKDEKRHEAKYDGHYLKYSLEYILQLYVDLKINPLFDQFYSYSPH